MLIFKRGVSRLVCVVFSVSFLLVLSAQGWQWNPESGTPPEADEGDTISGDTLALVWKGLKEGSDSSSDGCSSDTCDTDKADKKAKKAEKAEKKAEKKADKPGKGDRNGPKKVVIKDIGNVEGDNNEVDNDIDIRIVVPPESNEDEDSQ